MTMGSVCHHNSFCVGSNYVSQHICYEFLCWFVIFSSFVGLVIYLKITIHPRWFEPLIKILVVLFEKCDITPFIESFSQFLPIFMLLLLLFFLLFILLIKCTGLYSKCLVIPSSLLIEIRLDTY